METGVDNATAASAVGEFERFLELKKLANDRDGTLVAPSPLIRAVWRQAMLHTSRYRDSCASICGFFVDYDPRDELRADEDEFQLRYCSTWVALERRWGVPDPLVWPEPPGANHGIPVRAWVEKIDVDENARDGAPDTREFVLMSVPTAQRRRQQQRDESSSSSSSSSSSDVDPALVELRARLAIVHRRDGQFCARVGSVNKFFGDSEDAVVEQVWEAFGKDWSRQRLKLKLKKEND
jgi:hypothetical protein